MTYFKHFWMIKVALIAATCPLKLTIGNDHNSDALHLDIEFNDRNGAAFLPDVVVLATLRDGLGLGEGPVWDSAGERLFFSDIMANSVYSWSESDGFSFFLPKSGETGFSPSYPDGLLLGANGLAISNGEMILCQHGDRRLVSVPLDAPLPENYTTLTSDYAGSRYNSPNDLAISKDGLIYFTDPPYGFTDLPRSDPAAKRIVFDFQVREKDFNGVYVLDPIAKSVKLISSSIDFPNGIALADDESFLYVNSSNMAEPKMMRINLATGSEELFFDGPFPDDAVGWFDGMKMHSSGNIFTTGPGGILVISPEGKLLATIPLPGPATNLCFDGPEENIYVTSFESVVRISLDN